MNTFPPLPVRTPKNGLTCLIGLMALLLITNAPAHHRPGHSGGPGGDDGDDPCVARPNGFFPAMIYSVDRNDGTGLRNLMLGSSDGCLESVPVEEGRQLGGYRLQYSENVQAGFYTWVEHDFENSPLSTIWRQDFTVANNALDKDKLGLVRIYESQDFFIGGFDVREHNGVTTLSLVEDSVLLVINPSNCGAGPCTAADGVPVYSTAAGDCWIDLIGGCYEPSGVVMNVPGDHAYVGTDGDDEAGNRVSVIGSVELDAGVQTPQTKFILTDDNYREAGLNSLSSDGRYLAVRYLAGFLKGGLRDDRIIFLDTDCSSCNITNPLLPDNLAQDISSWSASWTVGDNVLLLGNEGRRRKLKHPMFEFDPFDPSGVREPLGIVLGDHPGIDSSL